MFGRVMVSFRRPSAVAHVLRPARTVGRMRRGARKSGRGCTGLKPFLD